MNTRDCHRRCRHCLIPSERAEAAVTTAHYVALERIDGSYLRKQYVSVYPRGYCVKPSFGRVRDGVAFAAGRARRIDSCSALRASHRDIRGSISSYPIFFLWLLLPLYSCPPYILRHVDPSRASCGWWGESREAIERFYHRAIVFPASILSRRELRRISVMQLSKVQR